MIAMQYKIVLPKDYDMGIIRKRVQDNGYKTDQFPGLHFKAYLITEEGKHGNLFNSYSPLYIWNNSEGMNRFIFEGYYDNILGSFGWQHIHIGVPLSLKLEKDFANSRYVVEYAGSIPKAKSLLNTSLNTSNHYFINKENILGDVLVYNPDKWCYSHFSFHHDKPQLNSSINLPVYEVLHISR